MSLRRFYNEEQAETKKFNKCYLKGGSLCNKETVCDLAT